MASTVISTNTTTSALLLPGDDLIVLPDASVVVSSANAVNINSGAAKTDVVNYGTLVGVTNAMLVQSPLELRNYGDITVLEGDGLFFIGDIISVNIENSGTITAPDYMFQTFPATGSMTFRLLNTGNITQQSLGSGFAFLWDSNTYSTVQIINTGFTRGGEIAVNGSVSGYLYNSGEMLHNLIDGDGSGAGLTLVNHGTLTDSDGGTFITGETSDVSSGDKIVNSGLIAGNITLGGAADEYVGVQSGTVLGTIDMGAGEDTAAGGAGADHILGGSQNDKLVGRAGEDTLSGDGGNDLIIGGTDDDLLSGGDDNDTLKAGAGNDTADGGAGDDTISGQDGDDDLTGDSGNDFILGGAGNDNVDAGTDNDTVTGNGGDDTLMGGGGNDLLVGQDGSDKIDGGADNDTMDGGAGNDTLEGDNGNDILRGRAGEDELAGGLGFDLLTGGGDADQFVFRSVAETAVGALRDQILDFEQGTDLIVVAGLSPGVFEFRGTNAFAPSGNPELRLVETASGSTIVQFDANGDGTADAEIRVANVTGLTADDFVL